MVQISLITHLGTAHLITHTTNGVRVKNEHTKRLSLHGYPSVTNVRPVRMMLCNELASRVSLRSVADLVAPQSVFTAVACSFDEEDCYRSYCRVCADPFCLRRKRICHTTHDEEANNDYDYDYDYNDDHGTHGHSRTDND